MFTQRDRLPPLSHRKLFVLYGVCKSECVCVRVSANPNAHTRLSCSRHSAQLWNLISPPLETHVQVRQKPACSLCHVCQQSVSLCAVCLGHCSPPQCCRRLRFHSEDLGGVLGNIELSQKRYDIGDTHINHPDCELLRPNLQEWSFFCFCAVVIQNHIRQSGQTLDEYSSCIKILNSWGLRGKKVVGWCDAARR